MSAIEEIGVGGQVAEDLAGASLVGDVTGEGVLHAAGLSPARRADGPRVLTPGQAQVMVDRKIGCLPVLDGDNLVGILSESDIVSAVAKGKL